MKFAAKETMALAIALMVPVTTLAAEEFPTVDIGGRLQLDYTLFDNDKFEFEDGGEIRRGRVFLQGQLAEDWDYKVQYDFAQDGPQLKDGYVRYSGFDNARIWLGSFKQPASLEQLTSSNDTTFAERAVASGVTEGRRLGIGYQGWGDRYTWMATAYGDEANRLAEGTGVAGRFVFRPRLSAGTLLHLGVSGSANESADDAIRLQVRPETHQDSHRILDTGVIEDVADFFRVGAEVAYVRGRFSAQGEFTDLGVNRRGAEDLSFSGYYVFVSLFLTDDSRHYEDKAGAFGRVKPTSEKGAWEVALRFGKLDLTDQDILGGEGDAITLVVNYYATANLRFTANYVAVDTDEVAGDDDPSALQVRLQAVF